ncbi:hypothetical protein BDZ91DRAFT_823332 [Kalaharituber pfeilii]|nr:hypothetical protein BDZ91DRAFT_823332 [Kalaharituber pfeilii]
MPIITDHPHRHVADIAVLRKWFQRGMLSPSAKRMYKAVGEELRGSNWTISANITWCKQRWINAERDLSNMCGGLETRRMEEALKWARRNPDPDPVIESRWCSWEEITQKCTQSSEDQYVATKKDFELLRIWFRRGLVYGYAKRIMKYLQVTNGGLHAGHWDTKKIQEWIKLEKAIINLYGTVYRDDEERVLQEALIWANKKRNPPPITDSPEEDWFDWEYHAKVLNETGKVKTEKNTTSWNHDSVDSKVNIKLKSEPGINVKTEFEKRLVLGKLPFPSTAKPSLQSQRNGVSQDIKPVLRNSVYDYPEYPSTKQEPPAKRCPGRPKKNIEMAYEPLIPRTTVKTPEQPVEKDPRPSQGEHVLQRAIERSKLDFIPQQGIQAHVMQTSLNPSHNTLSHTGERHLLPSLNTVLQCQSRPQKQAVYDTVPQFQQQRQSMYNQSTPQFQNQRQTPYKPIVPHFHNHPQATQYKSAPKVEQQLQVSHPMDPALTQHENTRPRAPTQQEPPQDITAAPVRIHSETTKVQPALKQISQKPPHPERRTPHVEKTVSAQTPSTRPTVISSVPEPEAFSKAQGVREATPEVQVKATQDQEADAQIPQELSPQTDQEATAQVICETQRLDEAIDLTTVTSDTTVDEGATQDSIEAAAPDEVVVVSDTVDLTDVDIQIIRESCVEGFSADEEQESTQDSNPAVEQGDELQPLGDSVEETISSENVEAVNLSSDRLEQGAKSPQLEELFATLNVDETQAENQLLERESGEVLDVISIESSFGASQEGRGPHELPALEEQLITEPSNLSVMTTGEGDAENEPDRTGPESRSALQSESESANAVDRPPQKIPLDFIDNNGITQDNEQGCDPGCVGFEEPSQSLTNSTVKPSPIIFTGSAVAKLEEAEINELAPKAAAQEATISVQGTDDNTTAADAHEKDNDIHIILRSWRATSETVGEDPSNDMQLVSDKRQESMALNMANNGNAQMIIRTQLNLPLEAADFSDGMMVTDAMDTEVTKSGSLERIPHTQNSPAPENIGAGDAKIVVHTEDKGSQVDMENRDIGAGAVSRALDPAGPDNAEVRDIEVTSCEQQNIEYHVPEEDNTSKVEVVFHPEGPIPMDVIDPNPAVQEASAPDASYEAAEDDNTDIAPSVIAPTSLTHEKRCKKRKRKASKREKTMPQGRRQVAVAAASTGNVAGTHSATPVTVNYVFNVKRMKVGQFVYGYGGGGGNGGADGAQVHGFGLGELLADT